MDQIGNPVSDILKIEISQRIEVIDTFGTDK